MTKRLKACITKFLPEKKVEPEPVPALLIEAVEAHYRQEAVLTQAGRALGYAEAIDDFSKGCTGKSNFALIVVSPVIQAMRVKLRDMK